MVDARPEVEATLAPGEQLRRAVLAAIPRTKKRVLWCRCCLAVPHLVRRLVARVRCGRSTVQRFARPVYSLSQRVSGGSSSMWGKRMGAWMRAARAAFWVMPRALSATPFSSGLFALANSCLMQYCVHTSPRSLPNNSPPLSDITLSTSDGTPLARTSAINFLKASAASELRSRKYTQVTG